MAAMDMQLSPHSRFRAALRDDLSARKDATVGLALLAVLEVVGASGTWQHRQKR
jgi:hypothetical protein